MYRALTTKKRNIALSLTQMECLAVIALTGEKTFFHANTCLQSSSTVKNTRGNLCQNSIETRVTSLLTPSAL